MKLTNMNKATIIENAIIKSGLRAKADEINAAYDKLGRAIRINGLGGKLNMVLIEQRLDELNSNIEFLRDYLSIAIYSGYRYKEFFLDASFGGMQHRFKLEFNKIELVPLLTNVRYAADHEFSIRFFELEKQKNTNDNAIADLKNKIRPILNSVNTDTQLLKIWPECAELLPHKESKTAIMLNTDVDTINKLLNLP